MIYGNTIKVLNGHTHWVYGCSISFDETFLVSCSFDKTLRVWDTTSGNFIKILQGHTKGVYACKISHNSKFIWSASDDHTVRVWDAKSGQCLKIYQNHYMVRSVDVFSVQ